MTVDNLVTIFVVPLLRSEGDVSVGGTHHRVVLYVGSMTL
jgi:hypothetical protein